MLRLALAAVSGTLYFLGFAGFDLWPLSFVALVPMLWALDPAHEKRAPSRRMLFATGATLGLFVHIGGYYWMVETLERFSGFPWLICVLIALMLWLFQGLMLALFAGLYRFARQHGVSNLLAASAAMCLAEWIYPRLFDHYFGASLHAQPTLLQVADVGGPLLLTGLLTAANVAVYELSLSYRDRHAPVRTVAIALAVWALTVGYGLYRIDEVERRVESAPTLGMGLVQADMGLFQKRDDPEVGLMRHLEQSEELEREHGKDLDLLVWPESAFAWYLPEKKTNVRDVVLRNRISTATLFGGLAVRQVGGKQRPFNTAFLTNAKGVIQGSYDKTYLLTFSEYIPLGEEFPVLYDWSPNSGQFVPGQRLDPVRFGPYRLSVLICYEDILPSFVRRMVRHANPHVLINLTNDAWFGDTHAPWEHLALAKLRAVEHHRALVRSTNSGVTAVVDPTGRLVAKSGLFTRENIFARIPMMTGASAYQTLGDFPGPLALLLFVGLWLRGRRRRQAASA